jgi:hypothetical protein
MSALPFNDSLSFIDLLFFAVALIVLLLSIRYLLA